MKESKFEIRKVYTIRWKNIGISKSEFVTKTKFLSECLIVTFKLFGLEDFFPTVSACFEICTI